MAREESIKPEPTTFRENLTGGGFQQLKRLPCFSSAAWLDGLDGAEQALLQRQARCPSIGIGTGIGRFRGGSLPE